MENVDLKNETPTDANNVLAAVFIPPFRVGRKQMRAVLDAKGAEVVIFPKGLENYAKEYADFLNSIRQNGC
jgi:phosphoserine phosphatase